MHASQLTDYRKNDVNRLKRIYSLGIYSHSHGPVLIVCWDAYLNLIREKNLHLKKII